MGFPLDREAPVGFVGAERDEFELFDFAEEIFYSDPINGSPSFHPACMQARTKSPARTSSQQLSVNSGLDGLCDRSRIGIGCDDLEVDMTNSFAPPFAHFGCRLAPDQAAELGKEAPIVAGGEGQVESSDCDRIRSSKSARRIRGH